MSGFNRAKETILKDMSASYWLKDALIALEKRDIVDALNDLDALTQLFSAKFNECNQDFNCEARQLGFTAL